MADIVLGLASARSPMVNLPPERWHTQGENDKASTRLRRGNGQAVTYQELLESANPAIAEGLTPDVWERQYAAAQRSIATLAATLTEVNPDVVLMMGDDQEVFIDGANRPGIMAYRGETFPTFIQSPVAGAAPEKIEQPVAVGLTEHIIRSLVNQEFDVADSVALTLLESNQGRGGHEFGWAYNRLMSNHPRSIVPFILNVHYPPNTPSPKRLYEFGRAVRRAVQSWPGNERVALIGTGGLSVGVLEEALDRSTLAAMGSHDVDALGKLNRDWLQGPTGETLLYIATAGAAEHLNMEVLEYIPAYRSPAGTGCGLAFVRWQ
jgi:3-O-methylgallate 3,4-dioxygenase